VNIVLYRESGRPPLKKKTSCKVALYYTRRPERRSAIFHINFLAVFMAAYFSREKYVARFWGTD